MITSVVAINCPQGAKAESGYKNKQWPKAWDVVWCHEHFWKKHRSKAFNEYSKICECVLASMIPKKKAKDYLVWRKEQQHSRPHLLMTTWREVKPILRGLKTAHGNSCYPLAILVLAESGTSIIPASECARSHTDVDMAVLPESDFERLKALLVRYSEKLPWVLLPEELSATYNMAQALPESTRTQEAVKNEPCVAPRPQGKSLSRFQILSTSPGTALSMSPFTGIQSETVKNEQYVAASCTIPVPAQMLSSSPGRASSTNKIRDSSTFLSDWLRGTDQNSIEV